MPNGTLVTTPPNSLTSDPSSPPGWPPPSPPHLPKKHLGTLLASHVHRGHTSYLSFFLHRQNFWRINFTPKNANFCQFFANFCQFTLKFAPKNANFCQFSPMFRVRSVKIYTRQKKFTRAPHVAPVTNMRYGLPLVQNISIGLS